MAIAKASQKPFHHSPASSLDVSSLSSIDNQSDVQNPSNSGLLSDDNASEDLDSELPSTGFDLNNAGFDLNNKRLLACLRRVQLPSDSEEYKILKNATKDLTEKIGKILKEYSDIGENIPEDPFK